MVELGSLLQNQAGVELLGRELAAGETVTLDLSDAQTARIRVGAAPQIDVFINDEKVEYGTSNYGQSYSKYDDSIY